MDKTEKNIHVRATKGSGGVGCFVRNSVTESFNVSIIDDLYDGILWLKFSPFNNEKPFYCCVCYLPPSDSTRNIDHGDFYDTFLFQIHTYCKDDFFYVCGDFNSRCGNLEDYIAGVDLIPERDVVDLTVNKDGERFCEFLIDSNCCIMNGRNYKKNDYTFISTQGSSVVDYCVTPYEHINLCRDVSVITTSDLISETGIQNRIDCPLAYPDHSLLVWTILVEGRMNNHQQVNETASFEIFERNIPPDFLGGKLNILIDYIESIEQEVNSQEELDNIYSNLMGTIKEEMYDSLSHKTVKVQLGANNKKRKVKKPWWTDHLSELWNNQCHAEKAMLRCKSKDRKQLRKSFIDKRKFFNREVQRSKRKFIMQKQADIDNLESSNPNLFWKEIGKIGIGQERRKTIPMEIIKPDGTTSSNTDEVVRKWKNDFETLLNPTNSNKIIKPMQDSDKIDDSQIAVPLYFEAPIQTCEVEQAVKRFYSILFYPITLEGRRGTTDEFATIPFHLDLFSAALVELAKSIPVHSLILSSHLFFCLPLFLFPFTVP